MESPILLLALTALGIAQEIILPESEIHNLHPVAEDVTDNDTIYIIKKKKGNESMFIFPEQDCLIANGQLILRRPTVILQEADEELFGQLADLCGQLHRRRINGTQFLNGVESYLFIYPGTKWCGAGNNAENDSDLGEHEETDKCCREHDGCENFMAGFTCRREIGLCNRSPITRSHCDCDERFRNCLMRAGEPTSNKIGHLYFTFFGVKCFRRDYPAVRCLKRGGFLRMHCQLYAFDRTRERMYQFFDSPKYNNSGSGLF